MTVLPVATRSSACCTKCSDSASKALERGWEEEERVGGGEEEREDRRTEGSKEAPTTTHVM